MGSCTTYLFSFLIACNLFSHAISDNDRKAYIVYMGSLPKDVDYSPYSHHLNILQSVLDGSSSAENYITRSYHNSFNGFVAKLTETEKQKLSSLEDVVSVFPDGIMKIQTTRSWDFMGFPETVTRNQIVESDIIIGVLDTGIWPESKSFSDEGFGPIPIPSKWKGLCQQSNSFRCNKKVIGARTLETISTGKKTPRDLNGHGSHTASIAAGSVVNGASFYGVAKGSARGAVPSSRIAAYKVCSEKGMCRDSDILAAFDVAIKDGVDIISVSLGSGQPHPFDTDTVAIGSFHAMEKGILTVQAGGNSGGFNGMISSVAPWLFSVAASSIDRRIVSNTILGNGENFIGNAVNSNTMEVKNYTLVFGKDATSSCSEMDGRYCVGGCLDRKLVKGKIVVCDDASLGDDVATRVSPGGVDEANRAGAIGAIIVSQIANLSSVFSLTTSSLNHGDFLKVKSYYNESKSHLGYIQKTEVRIDSSAPIVAGFSSIGPNKIAPDILKPDITAPGLNILAAFSPQSSPSQYAGDKRSVNYTILSGTSMACPHVSGASAYVKSFHPTWSPSAIKSALMTTALEMSVENNPSGEFGYGSGHINPAKAVEPGLVYESNTQDYMEFLCKQGYNATVIKKITGHNTSCSSNVTVKTSSTPADMNYPSMAAKIRSNSSQVTFVFQRTVTNVGWANSTYKANITSSHDLEVKVHPRTLSFKSLNERKSFNVSVVGGASIRAGASKSAYLTWFDGFHKVRSPIVIYKDSFKY